MTGTAYDVVYSYEGGLPGFARDYMRSISKQLENHGTSYFDYRQTEYAEGAGIKLRELIKRLYSTARCAVLFITKSFLNSSICRHELEVLERQNTPLIPVLCAKVSISDLPPSLRSLAHIDFHREEASKVVQAIQSKLIKETPKPARGAVAIDLDGTMFKGIKYSWSEIWSYLRIDDQIRRGLYAEYMRAAEDEPHRRQEHYDAWCKKCERQFIEKCLVRSDFKAIVGRARLAKNLVQGLELLRQEGFRLLLISGGVDEFLYNLLPQQTVERLFDFIAINRFNFEPARHEQLVSITPTRFDFNGKGAALRDYCTTHGISQENTVFVGDGTNDISGMTYARHRISFAEEGADVHGISDHQIFNDDFMDVVKAIFETFGIDTE